MDNQELLQIVKDFITKSFEKAKKPVGLKHYFRTLDWLLHFRPDADIAFQIAALAHDIEIAFRDPNYVGIQNSEKGFQDSTHLKYHSEKGAQIITEFLKSIKVDDTIANRVNHLISAHEVGGDEDQSLLRDVDSVSFFENQVDDFIARRVDLYGKDKVEEKFHEMYNRIQNEKAKFIANPLYKKALLLLQI